MARASEGEQREAGNELLTAAVALVEGVIFQGSLLVCEVLSAVQRSRLEEAELELRRPLAGPPPWSGVDWAAASRDTEVGERTRGGQNEVAVNGSDNKPRVLRKGLGVLLLVLGLLDSF